MWNGSAGWYIDGITETSVGLLHWDIPDQYCHNTSFQSLAVPLPVGFAEVPPFLLRGFDDWELESNMDQWWPVLTAQKVVQNLAKCWLWVTMYRTDSAQVRRGVSHGSSGRVEHAMLLGVMNKNKLIYLSWCLNLATFVHIALGWTQFCNQHCKPRSSDKQSENPLPLLPLCSLGFTTTSGVKVFFLLPECSSTPTTILWNPLYMSLWLNWPEACHY